MEQTTVMSARVTLSPTRKVRVFRCWFSTARNFFTSSLACSVAWTVEKQKRKKNYCKSCFPVPRCNNRVQSSRKLLFWLRNTELYTCLLNCMIPRVGKTHALAGGMISESAKLTHCSTWAAAWGVAPRRVSLLTTHARFKKGKLLLWFHSSSDFFFFFYFYSTTSAF